MISLLVVNYRSARLAAAAVASARAATAAALQVVVVDNSGEPAEAEALRRIEPDELLVSSTNRGYAGAINDGRRLCRGDVLVVSNPDVVFAAGCIDALAASLTGRIAAAGPALFWDDAHEWMLPPGDRLTAPEKLDEVLASRSPAWRRERDRRRIRRRVRFWSLSSTTAVDTLSGAVMAVRASDFDAAEGFDERFTLYFEETDFLRRLRAMRREVVVVPAARCRHVYNQSAGQASSEAASRYVDSERRYLEKWNGPFVARTLKSMERPMPAADAPRAALPLPLDRDDVVVEASPLATFTTSAGHFPRGGPVTIPPEILSSLRGTPLYVRVVVRGTAEELGRWRVA